MSALEATQSPRPLVLLVDDNETLLRATAVALSRKYKVETCTSAERALCVLEGVTPQAVVVDANMPTHDGYWLIEQYRQRGSKTPMILYSGWYEEPPGGADASAFQAVTFVCKGDPQDLLTAVDAAVARGRSA
jgi:CheY-like chemotaxis protein